MKKRKVIAVVLLGLGILCGAVGIMKYIEERNAGKEYEEIKEEVTKEIQEEPADTPDEEEETKTPIDVPVDFAALQQRNPDVYAWIQIPNTAVNYPILQSSTDNAYYLNHTIDREEKREGAIFTENFNTKTFEDPNTVIYGHDMKNGSMFQSIHNYMDRSFFDTNRDITIYMPEQILHYKIFAAYLTDNKHLLMNYNFWNQEEYKQYLDSIFSMRGMSAFVDTSMEVTNKDKILTLSTCYAGISTQRYLVQAVLVSIEK